jgi:hypothetical protein
MDIFFKFNIHFSIKFFLNGVRPDALCHWISSTVGGGFPAEQRGGKRPQEERRGCSQFYCSLEEGVPGENCSSSIQISAVGRNSQRASCLVFAPAVFETRRAPQETGFCCSGGILFTQSTHGCPALREILLIEEIQG